MGELGKNLQIALSRIDHPLGSISYKTACHLPPK